jgi:hypothetical protein
VTGPAVTAILDAKALLVYSRLDGLAVGELLGEIESDGGRSLLGIPVTSFLDAYAGSKGDERGRLVELATNPDRATVLLPLRGADALRVAELIDVYDQQTAQCVVEAQQRRVQLATYDAGRLQGVLDEDLTLDLQEP